jgi:hypothetical protein
VVAAMTRLVETPARTLREGARRIAAWVLGGLVALAAALRGVFESTEANPVERGEDAASGGAGAASSPRRSLAAAWRVLVDIVSPSRLRQRTPAEIARLAVEKGLPEGPVRALTAAYERAVYGPAGASEADVERAREAAATLEASADGTVADSSSTEASGADDEDGGASA